MSSMPERYSVERLGPGQSPDVVDVLAEAFRDYPVMRYVVGAAPDYEKRMRRLVELFVANRVLRDETIFGLFDAQGTLVGAATTTRPHSPEPSRRLLQLRDGIWSELGADARSRYDTFSEVTQRTAVAEPHVHLNMIGVRRVAQKRGLSRLLLQAVNELSDRSPGSTGVSLTTEVPGNVRLYEHFGFRIVGESPVGDAFTTWTMFRAGNG